MSGALRVLVAGGTGFLGSAIVRRLRDEGAEVVVAARSTGVDLTDWGAAARLPRVDVVVHAAGNASASDALASPREFCRDHFLITLNLLELARSSRARVVLASTWVYGLAPRVPAAESDDVGAHTPYAASRLMAERLGRDWQRDFGVAVDALRVFNAYGPGQRSSLVVGRIVAGAAAGRIELADPVPRRDFVHVDDVARAFALAARRTAPGFDVFNIGSGESRSIESVARAAARLAGGGIGIAWSGAKRAAEVPDARADVAKAARVLGWRPSIDFETGLASLVTSAKRSRS